MNGGFLNQKINEFEDQLKSSIDEALLEAQFDPQGTRLKLNEISKSVPDNHSLKRTIKNHLNSL